jgi:hypothetical protein
MTAHYNFILLFVGKSRMCDLDGCGEHEGIMGDVMVVPYKTNMDTQSAMSRRTVKANEHSICRCRPSWLTSTAIKAGL